SGEVAAYPLWIGWVAHVDQIQASITIRYIGEVARDRHPKRAPRGVDIAADQPRIGWVAHVDYLQTINAIRRIDKVARYRHAIKVPAGSIAAHPLWIGRVAHVDHLHSTIRHIGVVAR